MRAFKQAAIMMLCLALAGAAVTAQQPGQQKARAGATKKAGGKGGKGKKKAGGGQRQPLMVPTVSKDQQICFAMYTTQNGVLKLFTQLYPLAPDDPREVRLEVKQGGDWKEIARAKVREDSYDNAQYTPDQKPEQAWNALFRVEGWDMTKDVPYRVRHGASASYEGLIRHDPVEKKELVVAAFTGNGNSDRRVRTDIIRNVKAQDADLLFFSGDQSYDEKRHMAAWLQFGRQFGEILRDRPAVAIPDDHDVGQGNLWGQGGKKASTAAGDDGGYFMPAQYVKEVEFAQTANLPAPVDPTPIGQGIGVYFTKMNVGRVSFAIIEDRKFKTGPRGVVPQQGDRPDWVQDPNYDPKSLDVPGAELLGERQLKFLREWGQDWRGADMKAVLSQTVFTYATSLSGAAKTRLIADLDCDGWPQTGRNKAIAEMRRCFALHICGDQHLGSVVRYGVDDWNDSNVAYCVPSIVNYYPRYWEPLGEPHKKLPGAQPYNGEWLDGFGNKMTMLAYNNPDPARANRYGGEWGAKADGYGVIRFNVETRQMRLECWPRGVDVTVKPEQYEGWPITISQLENYGREAKAYLPTLNVAGMENPVVQVVSEKSGEIVYTLRIKGTSFRPKVFEAGKYSVKVGELGTDKVKTLSGVESLGADEQKTIEVKL